VIAIDDSRHIFKQNFLWFEVLYYSDNLKEQAGSSVLQAFSLAH
jgi:hypothetical protein